MKKPKAKVTGRYGDIAYLLSICSESLRRSGNNSKIKDMKKKVNECSSYDEALGIMNEYCEIV